MGMKKFKRTVAVACAVLLAFSSLGGSFNVKASEFECEVTEDIAAKDTYDGEETYDEIISEDVEEIVTDKEATEESVSEENAEEISPQETEANEKYTEKISEEEEASEEFVSEEAGDEESASCETDEEIVSEDEYVDEEIVSEENDEAILTEESETEETDLEEESETEETVSEDEQTPAEEILSDEITENAEYVEADEDLLCKEEVPPVVYTVVFYDLKGNKYYTLENVKEGSCVRLPKRPEGVVNKTVFDHWYILGENDEHVVFDEKTKVYANLEVRPETVNVFEVAFKVSIDSAEYTGKKVKPTVEILSSEISFTDHNLKEGKDFTVKYKNNIKSFTGLNTEKAPQAIITLKDYSSPIIEYFEILPCNINKVYEKDDLLFKYTGKKINPLGTLKYKGIKLKKNRDYTTVITGPDGNPTDTVKEAGSYVITVEGKGNFTGKRNVKVTVLPKDKYLSDAKFVGVKDVNLKSEYFNEFSTKGIVFDNLSIEYKGETIPADKYKVTYENNKSAGTATVIATGIKDGYRGTLKKTFKIIGYSASEYFRIEGLPESVEYQSAKYIVEPAVYDKVTGEKLSHDDAYDIEHTIKDKKVVGKLIGKGYYQGTVSFSYKLTPRTLTYESLNISNLKDCVYVKGQKFTPGFTLKVKATSAPTTLVELKKGKDYSIAGYGNNTVASTSEASAYVRVKFKGLYAGTVDIPFTVSKSNLSTLFERGGSIIVSGVKYADKEGNYVCPAVIKDINGKSLSAGKDYTIDYYRDSQFKNKLKPEDKVESDSKVYYKINGIGDYTGTYSEYWFKVSDTDISKAKVTVPSRVCTGVGLNFSEDQITVKIGGKTLSPSDYEIVDDTYKNHVKAGTGSFVIRAKGEGYYGTRKVSFKIKKGKLKLYR